MTTKNTAAAEQSETQDAAEDRVPAFKVGDSAYYFPAHIPPGWGLTYLRLHYASSPEHGLTWALTKLLGMDQYLALEEDPGLTREAFADAMAAARDALLGGMEGPKEP